MGEFLSGLSYFHFIRPWCLLLVLPALLAWWLTRRRLAPRWQKPAGMADHLAHALSLDGKRGKGLLPVDAVTLCSALIIAGAAGPSWTRVPNPLVAPTAPLVLALEVSDSMARRDIAPSRLDRAKYKIQDILDSRTGGRTALVAYAGSAHLIAPLTEDPDVLNSFLEGLLPDVMPVPGNNATLAVGKADTILSAETSPGAMLFVADEIDRADIPGLQSYLQNDGAPMIVLLITEDENAAEELRGIRGLRVVTMTPDDADVQAVSRHIDAAYRAALAADDRQKWEDRGWLFFLPALLLSLLWFRRGWTMRWGAGLLAAALFLPAGPSHADGLADWFWTPDQQGRRAYENRDYAEAAGLFQDLTWRGLALYRSGQYEDAAEIFDRLDGADALIARGMAEIRQGSYREGAATMQQAVDLDPDNALAVRNLEIAQAIVDYVNESRRESSADDGADEVVFDEEMEEGQEAQPIQTQQLELQAAEQWMRTVDTRMQDFLKIRLSLEAEATE
ncbi:vWA domain-containing protein [Paracoccus aerodenitrificans]|uniref:vWA domain-containing protein n=1 Tax=Paracoccus aerodenitrificans TaxID=3017781 RepID=UPI0022F0035A|nr:VWA domain-containing protein [Paracoccus aerodenitrificans]WBU63790.1 VWA domain-containing protein [Paracoccus aerodenitrificans]